MTDGLTRREAAGVLGVAISANTAEVKRRYRRLARDHHPDRGGDPEAFHSLHRAYLRLVEDDAPAAPKVARGRPSRTSSVFVEEPEGVDISGIDWDRSLADMAKHLDPDSVAVWLAHPEASIVRPLEATSRAPHSRLNRVAHLLSTELTSTLHIGEQRDDHRGVAVVIDVLGANRRARKALDVVSLGDDWVRKRRSTMTQLRCTITPSRDPRATAVRAVRLVTSLLDDLDWPLEDWRLPAKD